MKIEQIYTGCLAQGAYYIESNGEVAIIDPLREVQPYLDKARESNATIKYIFETHFHADFVSGHLDLAQKSGAQIVFGPLAKPTYDAYIASDGEVFEVGDIKIQAIHTPGHTMESTTYLLFDEQGIPKAIFTGDTLFIGDVGRPDLAQKLASDLTEEKLASYLYDSLHQKIMNLPDSIIVYPGHGAGSACGKNMSDETFDTLGNQKKTNYALQSMSKEQFIEKVLDGLTPPPAYFPENVMMNIQGYDSIDKVLGRGMNPLSLEEFEHLMNQEDVLILDTRGARQFVKGFIPNSINIGIEGNFAPWVGTVIPDINQKILLVLDEGFEQEVVTRLARVGYDNALGYIQGGFDTWLKAGKPIDTIDTITVKDLADLQKKETEITLLDIRRESEFLSERVEGALNEVLDYINNQETTIDPNKTYYVYCGGDYRSVLYISIMRQRGYTNLISIEDGMWGIKESGLFKLTAYVCPTTLL